MKFYTSYFASPKKFYDGSALYLSIAQKKPDWWTGDEYKVLAPPAELLYYYKNSMAKGDEPIDYIQSKYIDYFSEKVLNKLDFKEVLNHLTKWGEVLKVDKIVFCCYEKSGDFCHRYLVADWFKLNGVECIEV